jgi:polyketide synthase 7
VTALAGHLHRVLAPPPPAAEDTLRTALDQVQQAWPEPDDTTRRKITAILHSALARWDTSARTAPDDPDQISADKISSASDDEIFAFIDNEL